MLRSGYTLAVYVRLTINNTAKQLNSINNGTSEMEFPSLDVENSGFHNGIGLVEISNVFVMKDDIFL